MEDWEAGLGFFLSLSGGNLWIQIQVRLVDCLQMLAGWHLQILPWVLKDSWLVGRQVTLMEYEVSNNDRPGDSARNIQKKHNTWFTARSTFFPQWKLLLCERANQSRQVKNKMHKNIEEIPILMLLRKLMSFLNFPRALSLFCFFNNECSKAKQLLRTAMNFLTACNCRCTVIQQVLSCARNTQLGSKDCQTGVT